MGVIAQWDNAEKKDVRLDFEGYWDWDEYRSGIARAIEMVESVSWPVDLIFDFSRSGILSSDAVTGQSGILNLLPHNAGAIVIAGTSSFVIGVAALYKRIYPLLAHRIKVAGSLEEARTLLSGQLV